MRYILALDPGTEITAWLVLSAEKTIEQFGLEANAKISRMFRYDCWPLHVHYVDDEMEVVCEQIQSFGMAVGATTFQTVRWEGRFWESCEREKVPFKFVTRMQVKQAICHDARAKDMNIRQALIDRYGPQGTKRNKGATYGISKDVWSALAIATTALELKL
jgi:hypothetical protein